jgi:hypothetical protein
MVMEKEREARKEEGSFSSAAIFRYFRVGVFIILMLLLLVASFQFYFFSMDAIAQLFAYEYRSLVQAGFAASVIAIIVYLLRGVIIKET